jgi:hypothetical protein
MTSGGRNHGESALQSSRSDYGRPDADYNDLALYFPQQRAVRTGCVRQSIETDWQAVELRLHGDCRRGRQLMQVV